MKNKTLTNIVFLVGIIVLINYLTKNKIIDYFKKFLNQYNNEEIEEKKLEDKQEIENKFVFTYQEPKENLTIKNKLIKYSNKIKIPEELIIPQDLKERNKNNISIFLNKTLDIFNNISFIGNIKFKKYKNNLVEILPFNVKAYYKDKNFEGNCILSVSLVHELTDKKDIFINNNYLQFDNNYGEYFITSVKLLNFIKVEIEEIIEKKEDDDEKLIMTDDLNVTELDSIQSLIPNEIILSSEYEEDSIEETTINNDQFAVL